MIVDGNKYMIGRTEFHSGSESGLFFYSIDYTLENKHVMLLVFDSRQIVTGDNVEVDVQFGSGDMELRSHGQISVKRLENGSYKLYFSNMAGWEKKNKDKKVKMSLHYEGPIY